MYVSIKIHNESLPFESDGDRSDETFQCWSGKVTMSCLASSHVISPMYVLDKAQLKLAHCTGAPGEKDQPHTHTKRPFKIVTALVH